MYIVIELQKNELGIVSTIVTEHPTLAEAESKYHSILAFASISDVPIHSAAIITDEGVTVSHKCYKHQQSQYL